MWPRDCDPAFCQSGEKSYRRPRCRRSIPPMRALCSFLLFGTFALAMPASASEKHVAEVLDRVLQSKRALEASPACKEGCVFLSAWDFDGTILKGDASEGLSEDNHVVYPGLAQKSIEAGFSGLYKKTEFQKFWHDYEEMDQKQGHIPAYTYLPKTMKGTKADEIKKFAGNYYATVLKPYYFESSIDIFQKLKQSGVIPYVISAAPHVFVSSSGPTLGIDEQHIFGIELALTKDGVLTDRVIDPIPYAEGKAKRLAMIVDQEKARSKKSVYVLASFGNSYHTDSGFLKWTLAQSFPVGKPLAVMINGGSAPAELTGKFFEVSQRAVLAK